MKKEIELGYTMGSIFLVLLILLTGSCPSSQTNRMNEKTLSENKRVILEAITIAGETSYPTGQILDLRVYDDMEVEFDFYPPYTPNRLGMKFTSETKKDVLSQEDYSKITSLLTQPDILTSENYYPPGKQRSVDSSIKRVIYISFGGKEKRTVLEEHDSHLRLKERREVYPKSLIDLIELIDVLNKKLRVKIDPESR